MWHSSEHKGQFTAKTIQKPHPREPCQALPGLCLLILTILILKLSKSVEVLCATTCSTLTLRYSEILWDTLSLCPTANDTVLWQPRPKRSGRLGLYWSQRLQEGCSLLSQRQSKKKSMERVEWVHCVGQSWIDILTWVIIVVLLQGCLVLRSMMLHDIHMVSLWVSIVSFVNPLMSNRGWLSWAWLRIPKVQIATVMYTVSLIETTSSISFNMLRSCFQSKSLCIT
jgi:hypothetical protein